MFSNARVQRVIDDLSDHTYRDYFMENAHVRFLFTSCIVSENERVSAARIEYISNFIENQKPNLQFLFTTKVKVYSMWSESTSTVPVANVMIKTTTDGLKTALIWSVAFWWWVETPLGACAPPVEGIRCLAAHVVISYTREWQWTHHTHCFFYKDIDLTSKLECGLFSWYIPRNT